MFILVEFSLHLQLGIGAVDHSILLFLRLLESLEAPIIQKFQGWVEVLQIEVDDQPHDVLRVRYVKQLRAVTLGAHHNALQGAYNFLGCEGYLRL